MLAIMVAFALTAARTASAELSGGQSGALNRVSAGTHVLGFGNAVTALTNDPATILVNPSGAALMRNGKLVVSHTRLPMDRTIGVVGFGRQIDQRAGFAVTWVSGHVDGVTRYDANGIPTGTIGNSENALTMAFGTSFQHVVFGVATKWYRLELDNRSSTSWSMSIGAMYEPVVGLRFGASVRDVGGDLRWFTERTEGQLQVNDPFPKTFSAGASYTYQPFGLTGAVSYENVDDEGSYAHLGVSWRVVRQLTVRAGYRSLNLQDSVHDAALSGGVTLSTGFGGNRVNIDYGVTDDLFGLIHSIGFRFDL